MKLRPSFQPPEQLIVFVALERAPPLAAVFHPGVIHLASWGTRGCGEGWVGIIQSPGYLDWTLPDITPIGCPPELIHPLLCSHESGSYLGGCEPYPRPVTSLRSYTGGDRAKTRSAIRGSHYLSIPTCQVSRGSADRSYDRWNIKRSLGMRDDAPMASGISRPVYLRRHCTSTI